MRVGVGLQDQPRKSGGPELCRELPVPLRGQTGEYVPRLFRAIPFLRLLAIQFAVGFPYLTQVRHF